MKRIIIIAISIILSSYTNVGGKSIQDGRGIKKLMKNYYGEKILEERMLQMEYYAYISELPNYEGYRLKGLVDMKKMMNTYNP